MTYDNGYSQKNILTYEEKIQLKTLDYQVPSVNYALGTYWEKNERSWRIGKALGKRKLQNISIICKVFVELRESLHRATKNLL